MYDPISVYYFGSGTGAWAFIVKADDKVIGQEAGILGVTDHQTDIHVEYFAVLQAMEWMFKRKMQHENIRFYGAKRGVVNHLNGVWDVDTSLAEPFAILHNKRRKFEDIGFSLVTKRQNQEAIDLAKNQLRERGPFRVEQPSLE